MLQIKYLLISVGLPLALCAHSKVLPFGTFPIGESDVIFYPGGYSQDFVESNLFAIETVNDPLLERYFNYVATFCGADNFNHSDNVIKTPTLVSRFTTHKGCYVPVLSIGKAFKDATASEVWIQDAITTIEDEAFANAKAISSLVMPMSLSYLGTSSLEGMSGLSSIYFRASLPPACKIEYAHQFPDIWQTGSVCDNIPASYTTPFGNENQEINCTIFVPRGALSFYLTHPLFSGLNLEEFEPETAVPHNPEGTCDIMFAKSGNFTLEAITYNGNASTLEIPSSIASDDYELSVSMRENPYTVTGIGYRSFAGKNIVNYTIPSSVVYIKDEAFADSEAETIVIGEGVRFVGARAFAGMKNLNKFTILPSATGEKRFFAIDAFEGINKDAVLICDFSDPSINRMERPFNAFSKMLDIRTSVNFIENTEECKLGVFAADGSISLCNYLDSPVDIIIVNAAGIITYCGAIPGGETIITAPAGVYFVKASSSIKKIIVK